VLDKSQDLIVCADVIEHVSNCDDFLMEIKRMLKPHGRAVLSTPVRITERPADDEHVMEFFPDEFNKLVRKYFIIDNHSYCISVFALDLYTWKPSFFLKRALIGWLMSSLNILLGCNVMKRMSSNNNLWTTQVINGIDGG
jgi:ubiquinone/menaquinone biosynthesis C-methylase UbiE